MAWGIAGLTALVKILDRKLDAIAGEILRLERKINEMAKSIADLDVALDAVAANETKLGQDIKTVIDALKAANLPPDLSAQVSRLEGIAQDLVNSDADTLAALPPVP